jgi:hypothetical protein
MVQSNSLAASLLSCVIGLWLPVTVYGAGPSKAHPRPKVEIQRDAATGKVILSWNGKGVLKQSPRPSDRFRPVRKARRTHVLETTQEAMFFHADTHAGLFSANAVGYVNLPLPPGLSLIATPLRYFSNTVAFLWPTAPDGAQLFKYVPGQGYEVSTFDGVAKAWSNPDMDLSPGTGYYFRNPSSETVLQTFVGEVLQGILVNPLLAGFSMKGSLVPQSGSINSVHRIPGQPGDVIHFHINDGEGGGTFQSSFFDEDENAWVPDLILNVAQGFWIFKENPGDWVRIFDVNN